MPRELLRCELKGTNCEAHIKVLSNKDTFRMIDKLGEDGLMEVLETNENTILKDIVLSKGVKTKMNNCQ